MKDLIEKIESKNTWSNKELSRLLAETSTKYSDRAIKPLDLNKSKNLKCTVIINTCNQVLVEIQTFPTWGKNIIKDKIFKKLVEELY